jgi:hypothetical protein
MAYVVGFGFVMVILAIVLGAWIILDEFDL